MAQYFKKKIMIVKSDGIHYVGEEFDSDSIIKLSYHLHYYGLGAHYNSLRSKIVTEDN
jgi:hypothetical protein